jgi:hypothetical protein
MDGKELWDGIFALRTRRFGSVAECMVKRLRKYGKAKSLFHDLFDEEKGDRIEVKFSTVLKKAEKAVTEESVLVCIEEATAENRMVAFPNWEQYKFDCNIQQVKRLEFEVLFYGLFFSDCIKIFRVESSDIRENRLGGDIGYSDKQHKGNVGEGQFHINDKTLQTHLDKYLHKTLTYEDLYRLLSETA